MCDIQGCDRESKDKEDEGDEDDRFTTFLGILATKIDRTPIFVLLEYDR
ncbi:hypothetical protein [Microseira sp. BLCC-F43]